MFGYMRIEVFTLGITNGMVLSLSGKLSTALNATFDSDGAQGARFCTAGAHLLVITHEFIFTLVTRDRGERDKMAMGTRS